MTHDGGMTLGRGMAGAARAARVAAAIAAVVVLAGCTAGEPDIAETPSPTPTPTVACIVGTWTTEAARLQALYDAIPAELDYPAATIGPEASVTVSFTADGIFALEQAVPATLTWMGHPASVALGGSMTGIYRSSGRTLALTATQNDLTVEPSDDRTASTLFAAATQETLQEWPVSASSFACDARTLVLDLETEGHPAAVEFTRR